MIHVSRQRRDATGQFIIPHPEWFAKAAEEQNRANADKGGSGYTFRNDVYGADVVRAALGELFFDKCGYCEFKLARTDLDVDHYRPKGAVAEAKCHPGYYWLAYDWSNLIPACKFCNEKRRELPKWPATKRSSSSGKADSFPLVDENKRAWSPESDISLEDPLLLNPTAEDPSEHLTFDPDGIAAPSTDKGEASISVFNLNARRLYEMRRCVIREVVCLLEMKMEAESFASEAQAPALALAGKIETLIEGKTDSSAQYAAVARAVVRHPSAFGL